ncbi:hypothetical protein, partial [Vibrio anguillarum]|uniref:hypothetical protein n=1 Tax=Vibrio anguillarum TaxID=55601 RepID=UPI00188D6C5F
KLMSFLGSSKRKILTSSIAKPENLIELSAHVRFITDGRSIADFERLNYKGCPVLDLPIHKIKVNSSRIEKIEMNRRSLVNKITTTVNLMERTTRTKINTFSVLVALFRFCDENNIENILTVSTIAEYLKKSVTEYHKGK